jgi:SAM-dependent methyltransferase
MRYLFTNNPTVLMLPYKQRLYEAYVSSGQASLSPASAAQTHSPAVAFRGNQPYADAVIKPLLPASKAAQILDLGCGNGCFIHFLKQYGYTNVVGVDTSAEQVAMAHQLGLHEVQQGEIMPFLASYTQSVEVILLMDVIEHLTPQETFDLLDQVYALLQPGGKLIVHVPNAEGLFGMRIRYGDLTHEQCFTPNSIRQLMKAIGFSQLVCREDKPVIHGLVSTIRRLIWELGTLPSRLLLMAETGSPSAILSQNMLVIATK